jgi:hypothetical protein
VSNIIIEYYGRTNPNVWLEDYRLVCRAHEADDDLFIIEFLPIYLADSARASWDHLLRNIINSWENLKEIFTDNFQGMYVWPDNPWDLKSWQQKSDKSLRDYIRRFTQKYHVLPRVADVNIILDFWSGMMCHTLVHRLTCD